MKWQRLAVILTMLNFVLLAIFMAQLRPVSAASEVAPVLRGRALELVDDQGRVRATINVFPAQPNLKLYNGKVGFPEVVELRLIDASGSPHVKLGTMSDGSGLMLAGDGGYLQLDSRGGKHVIKIVRHGREQIVATSDGTSSGSK
jgi:hypothetical protein